MPVHQEDQQTEPARRPTHRPARAESDAAGPAASGTPEQQRILALQRLAGNRAVVHALGHQPAAPRHAPALPVQRADDDRLPGVLRNDQRSSQMKKPKSKDQRALEEVFPRNEDGTFVRFPNPVAPPREAEAEGGGGGGGDALAVTQGLVRGLSRALSRIGLREEASSADAVNPEQTGGAVSEDAAYVEPAEWVKRINPRRNEGGPLGPYRRNCIDTARSFLASWSGNPTVAVGVKKKGVEEGGNDRTVNWLNAGAFRDPDRYTIGLPDVEAREIRTSWQSVHGVVQRGEHGTAALVVFHPKDAAHDYSHAVCAVNYQDQVLWVDAQRGTVSTTPMYEGTNVLTVVLNPQFTPVQPPTADVGISLD